MTASVTMIGSVRCNTHGWILQWAKGVATTANVETHVHGEYMITNRLLTKQDCSYQGEALNVAIIFSGRWINVHDRRDGRFARLQGFDPLPTQKVLPLVLFYDIQLWLTDTKFFLKVS